MTSTTAESAPQRHLGGYGTTSRGDNVQAEREHHQPSDVEHVERPDERFVGAPAAEHALQARAHCVRVHLDRVVCGLDYRQDEEEDEPESEEELEPEPAEEPEEESEEESSDDDDDEDSYDEESISNLKGGKGTLKMILKNIANREKNSYTYGNIQNMKRDKLIEIALTCQGKRVCSKKSDYKFKKEEEIESMSEKQLRELLNEMTNREPGTFKYSESSWARGKLIHFILTCQGSSKPSEIGRTSFVGGGWSL